MSSSPSDLVAYAHAYRAAEVHSVEQLRAIDRQFTALLWAQDLRQASIRSGRALLHTAETLIESLTLQQFADDVRSGCSDGNAVVCFGLVCSLWQISIRTGGITHLYTFAVSFLGAAVRLGCLGHRETQRILLALHPQFPTLVDEALMRELDEMSTFAPLADIRAMQHASLPVRLFAS
jgi:urease accessory protein